MLTKQLQPSSSWTSHLDKEKQEEFSKRLLVAKDLFERLYDMLEQKNKDNTKERLSKGSYETPAWSEYQADCNGYERAISQVQSLLKFTKE